MKRSLSLALIACIVAAGVLFIRIKEASKATDNEKELHGPYKVVRVVDGDTFKVSIAEEEYRVRLIGIDTPESVASAKYLEQSGKENTDEGKEASDFTKELVEGEEIYLEFDVSESDRYARLLAYVYLKDGRMLQDILLSEGLAQLMTVPPNVKYADHFTELQTKARKEGKGFWGSGFYE